uniref:Uncharacterized protein n=1 Tax=Cyprinus carpio TaxID=7962 RepID=A0A8C1VSI5_CYPCA
MNYYEKQRNTIYFFSILPTQFFAWCIFHVHVSLLCKCGTALFYICLSQVCNPGVGDTIHNYCAKTINGTQYIPFSYFAGKHVLIVNVATF